MLSDSISRDQSERTKWRERQRAKMGDYCDVDCPNCGRHRVMLGEDGKKRCEKCAWCVEDAAYDGEFVDYIHG